MQIATDNGRYVIRPYTPTDLDAALRAWEAPFHEPMSTELWCWKYHDAPYGHQVMVCAHEGGEIAALYGGLPYAADWAGRTLYIGQLMDNLSHPAHRGVLGGRNGIFARTVQEHFRVYGSPAASSWLYGLPGHRHFLLGKRLLGYRRLPGGMRYLTAGTEHVALRRRRLHRGRVRPIGEENLGGLALLSAKVTRTGRLMARRDATFFRWRFLLNPQRRYRAWFYRPLLGGDWLGYLVAFIEGSSAVLVDLLLPPRPDQVADLLSRVSNELRAAGVEEIRTWLPANSPETQRLAKIGFAVHDDPLGIIPTARTFDPALDWERTAPRLYYTMADSDLF